MANKEGKKRSGCRIVLIVLLVLILALAAAAFIWWKVHEEEFHEYMSTVQTGAVVGEEAADFEVTSTDGEKISLDGLLEGKEAAVIVLFATWCGPCEKEFPEMDKVYRQYKDKIGMIALDIDVLDSDDDAKEYRESHGLSFPVAYSKDLPDTYETNSFPTTIIIDRNGKIGCCRVGSIPDAEKFETMITTFLGDEYQEKHLAYYTIYAYADKKNVPGVEFSVTSKDGTETYTTDKDGQVEIITEEPEDMKIKVISVPDGYKIDEGGETSTGLISTYVKLPVSSESDG